MQGNELVLLPLLGAAIAGIFEWLIPFLEPVLPDSGPLRTFVIRLMAFIAGVLVLAQSGPEGLIAQDPVLSFFPWPISVFLGGVAIIFWSGLGHYAFKGAKASAKNATVRAEIQTNTLEKQTGRGQTAEYEPPALGTLR